MAARADDREAQADALIQGVLVGEAVANAGYVILVADEMMRYLAASDAACDLLGYSRERATRSQRSLDLVVESNASTLYDEFMHNQGQRGLIFTLRCKDGRHLELHIRRPPNRSRRVALLRLGALTRRVNPRHSSALGGQAHSGNTGPGERDPKVVASHQARRAVTQRSRAPPPPGTPRQPRPAASAVAV